jgi:indolepyruvate ferredoxin oxidoreductase
LGASVSGQVSSAGRRYADGSTPADPTIPDHATIVIVGIGGTGVVTVSQVLSTAATIDGKTASSLDQTGLAQKGGQVISNLHIAAETYNGAAKVGGGEADVLLVFDIVGGSTTSVLERAESGRTVAVVSTSRVPTGHMVSRTSNEHFPELAAFQATIDGATDRSSNIWIDAEAITRFVFSSQPAANVLSLGLAYQRGLLPVSADAIERAIELNGVAVDTNREAFRLGRRLAVDTALVAALSEAAAVESPSPPPPTVQTETLISSVPDASAELVEILQWRIPELVAWGDAKYASEYVSNIRKVRTAEIRVAEGRSALSEAAARHLFKLMAYKDEYEVARLAMSSSIGAQARARFGPNAKVGYQLKPPTLKNVGYDKKISIPESAGRKMFGSLLRTKRLRGTRLDPFGRTEERTIERALIGEYVELLHQIRTNVNTTNYDRAVEIADLADQIRGFDTIKLANVERYRRSVDDLMSGFLGADDSESDTE